MRRAEHVSKKERDGKLLVPTPAEPWRPFRIVDPAVAAMYSLDTPISELEELTCPYWECVLRKPLYISIPQEGVQLDCPVHKEGHFLSGPRVTWGPPGRLWGNLRWR